MASVCFAGSWAFPKISQNKNLWVNRSLEEREKEGYFGERIGRYDNRSI